MMEWPSGSGDWSLNNIYIFELGETFMGEV